MVLKSMEKPEVNTAVLVIDVTVEEFESGLDQAYRKNRHEITVPGFRKGRAPRKVIEANYGTSFFYDDAINFTYPKAYAEAVVEAELNPVDNPQVELVEFFEAGGYSFKATVTLYPEIKIGKYKGLTAERSVAPVTAEEIDAEIEKLRDRNARMESAGRAVQDGDIAVIDFEGFLEGVAFEGGKAEKYNLDIGSGNFIPGFEEQLIGMSAGEEKEINVTFPEDYNEELGGKEVVFKIKLHEVKEKILPELDDEFAKDVSEFDTMDQLRENAEKQMALSREVAADDAFINSLLGQVIEDSEAEVPKVLIDNQIEMMLQDQDMRLKQQGISLEQYVEMLGQTMDMVRDSARPSAERYVKTEIALNRIAELEEVEVSEEELEAEYKAFAEMYGAEIDIVKKSIKEEDIRPLVLRRKAENIIKDSADATEPKPEEEKKTAKKTTANKTAAKKTTVKAKKAEPSDEAAEEKSDKAAEEKSEE